MEILFNYRPDGQMITTDKGELKLMIFRRGPRGIVAMVRGFGPIVIYNNEEVENHINDTEEQLKERLIEVINNQ
jgi:hypothetical protein